MKWTFGIEYWIDIEKTWNGHIGYGINIYRKTWDGTYNVKKWTSTFEFYFLFSARGVSTIRNDFYCQSKESLPPMHIPIPTHSCTSSPLGGQEWEERDVRDEREREREGAVREQERSERLERWREIRELRGMREIRKMREMRVGDREEGARARKRGQDKTESSITMCERRNHGKHRRWKGDAPNTSCSIRERCNKKQETTCYVYDCIWLLIYLQAHVAHCDVHVMWGIRFHLHIRYPRKTYINNGSLPSTSIPT